MFTPITESGGMGHSQSSTTLPSREAQKTALFPNAIESVAPSTLKASLATSNGGSVTPSELATAIIAAHVSALDDPHPAPTDQLGNVSVKVNFPP